MLKSVLRSVRTEAPAPVDAAIEFDDVSLAFGGDGGAMMALDHVSLTVPRGQITTGDRMLMSFSGVIRKFSPRG